MERGSNAVPLCGILASAPIKLYYVGEGVDENMKFILKILLAPVMLVLAFLIWLCTLTLHISAVLLNILSVLLVLVSVFSFIDHNVKNGVIELVAAFLLSPYGLPMLGAWLVAQLHLLRDWMKEKVYW